MYLLFCIFIYFFFFKQKTAYEMRISDWSSDVCSSDLRDKRFGRCPDSPCYGGVVRPHTPGECAEGGKDQPARRVDEAAAGEILAAHAHAQLGMPMSRNLGPSVDRKSTRLKSSH